MSGLRILTTLNLAVNSLEGDLEIAGLDQCEKLSVVDVSGIESYTCLFWIRRMLSQATI